MIGLLVHHTLHRRPVRRHPHPIPSSMSSRHMVGRLWWPVVVAHIVGLVMMMLVRVVVHVVGNGHDLVVMVMVVMAFTI